MEKLKPTYDLGKIKQVLGAAATLSMTTTAAIDARALGFESEDIAAIIRSIDRSMFYKSMTTFHDARMWQDVYHVPVGRLQLYVKFQANVVTQFTLMSFKQR